MLTLEERLRRVRLIVSDVDGVLTDGLMGIDAEGRHFRFFSVRDGLGLAMWRLCDGRIALVTGLGSAAVETIAKQWKCVACLTHVVQKSKACRELAEAQGVSLEEMAFVGDDLIDLDALAIVGLAVAAHDAVPAVKAAAHWTTDTPGGKGVLREVVERILHAQGRYEEAVARYAEWNVNRQ